MDINKNQFIGAMIGFATGCAVFAPKFWPIVTSPNVTTLSDVGSVLPYIGIPVAGLIAGEVIGAAIGRYFNREETKPNNSSNPSHPINSAASHDRSHDPGNSTQYTPLEVKCESDLAVLEAKKKGCRYFAGGVVTASHSIQNTGNKIL